MAEITIVPLALKRRNAVVGWRLAVGLLVLIWLFSIIVNIIVKTDCVLLNDAVFHVFVLLGVDVERDVQLGRHIVAAIIGRRSNPVYRRCDVAGIATLRDNGVENVEIVCANVQCYGCRCVFLALYQLGFDAADKSRDPQFKRSTADFFATYGRWHECDGVVKKWH